MADITERENTFEIETYLTSKTIPAQDVEKGLTESDQYGQPLCLVRLGKEFLDCQVQELAIGEEETKVTLWFEDSAKDSLESLTKALTKKTKGFELALWREKESSFPFELRLHEPQDGWKEKTEEFPGIGTSLPIVFKTEPESVFYLDT